MNDFTGLLVGIIIGFVLCFVVGLVAMGSIYDNNIGLKLSNVMNASMLDCVTNKVITKEQVHDIEVIFHKHIEENFKHIKANHGDKWGRRMTILLCISVILALCSCLLIIKAIWYDRKHGMKYTWTDSSLTAEWDFKSPLTMLKLTKLFIQDETNQEQRRKYIREYTRLKKSLKDAGYDISDFPDYEIK